MTFYLARVVFLLSLPWLCLVFYRHAAHGFLFLTLLFVALAGWPMAVLDGFFWLLGSVADWPLAYYVFGTLLQPYDFGSVGYAVFLCLYIARREPIRLWECAALTVAGQLIFENYGVVTGIALFAATLLADRRQAVPSRLWLASRRLAVAGAASVVLAGLFAVIHAGLAAGLTDAATAAETPLAVLADYFASHWQDYGRTNFSWFNVIAANVISLISIPLILGVGFGAVVALTDRNRDPAGIREARADCAAALAVAAGLGVTVVIGLFISGLSSDMGRQLLPLVAATIVFASKMGEWLCRRALARRETIPP